MAVKFHEPTAFSPSPSISAYPLRFRLARPLERHSAQAPPVNILIAEWQKLRDLQVKLFCVDCQLFHVPNHTPYVIAPSHHSPVVQRCVVLHNEMPLCNIVFMEGPRGYTQELHRRFRSVSILAVRNGGLRGISAWLLETVEITKAEIPHTPVHQSSLV